MSFKPSVSKVSIFNKALALLPADPVEDPDEIGLEARECRRFYKGVVGKLLERHHWNLASQRVVLAEITNDRVNEWTYAYAKPNDMAYPVAVIDQNGRNWSGWTMQDYVYALSGKPLLYQVGGTLYSMVQAAGLEYTSFNITEADFSARFEDIVVKELAGHICHPVIKDDRRANALRAEAEFEVQRAIASDLNRNNPTYGNGPSETELVRGVSYDRTFAGTGYALDPVAYPANTGT
jgi:hypothetical protein